MKLEPLGYRYYVDAAGKLIGAFGGTRRTNDDETVEDLWPDAPTGGTLVSTPPPDSNTKRVWDGQAWGSVAPSVEKSLREELDALKAEIEVLKSKP